MRNIIIIISLLLSINNYTQTKTMTTEIKRPSINNKVERLDIKQYEKNFTVYYPSSSDPSDKEYEYKEETEEYILTIKGDYEYGFIYEKKIKSFPYNYSIFKCFYPNFSLQFKFIAARVINSESINLLGNGYDFNEGGKLIKVENYDKGWNFSYEQAVKFAQNKYDEYTFKEMKIYKTTENGWKYWFLSAGGDGFGHGEIEELKLDGRTGEILSYVIKYIPRYGAIKVLKVIVPDKTNKNYKKKTTSFQGKTYTEEEWKAFEQEQWGKYQANRNHKSFWEWLFG